MARATESTTAMAMSPPVPPVHALITSATPTKMRAHARKTGMLTETAPAAWSRPTTPPPMSSTLSTMPVSERPRGGSISLAGGPHPAPPPPLGGGSGGGAGGGGVSARGSVGAASPPALPAGSALPAVSALSGSDGGGGDHGYGV